MYIISCVPEIYDSHENNVYFLDNCYITWKRIHLFYVYANNGAIKTF